MEIVTNIAFFDTYINGKARRVRLLNKNTRHFYAEKPEFQVRLLTINVLILLSLFSTEFILSYRFQFYETAPWLVIAFGLPILALVVMVWFGKGTKKDWANLVSLIGVSGVAILTYRIIQNDDNILIIAQLILFIIALSFLFDRIIHTVIFSIGVSLSYSVACFFMNEVSQEQMLYLFAIPFALLILIYNLKVKLHRLSILEFSESVLSHYDKFVFVYNSEGDVVYINNYAAERFEFNHTKNKYDNWWNSRGYGPDEEAMYKKVVKDAIAADAKIPMHQMKTFLPNRDEITIEWNDQIIRKKFYVGIGTDVTLQSIENLEAQRLSKVTHALQAGVSTVNRLGQVTWCNSSYAKIFGYEVNEIIGKRPSQIFGVPAFFTERYDQILSHGVQMGVPIEIPQYTKSGRLIWVLLNTSQILDEKGVLIEGIDVVTDITEQKNNEFQFKQTSLIVERTQTPVLITDLDLVVNWFNDAVMNEFNLAFDEIIGEQFETRFLTLNYSLEILDVISQTIDRKESIKVELPLRRNEVSEWYKVTLDPIRDEADNITQYLIVLNNIQSLKEQQRIIQQKNKDMIASISYAKRIQSAFLPTSQILEEEMPHHFFFFKPKDIVSGDFYFVKRKGAFLYIAVADCTGHGVPGAMISAIAAASLNNAIFDHQLVYPAEILEHADQYVKRALSASEEELTDGMDVGLLLVDFNANQLRYAGSRRPIILMKQGEQIFIKGNKRSIGEFQDEFHEKFIEHTWLVDSEISTYLFSDGVPDQFGGNKHKKIGVRRILKFISDHNELNCGDLSEEFSRQMCEWTDDYNIIQTDDMVFMGAKFNPEYMLAMKNKWTQDES